MVTLECISQSAAQTVQIGCEIGRMLIPGDVLCLSGELGAGKTVLASGIGRGWGAVEPVNSPTFVFIHEHARQADDLRLYHIDCYRLEGPGDAASIGLEDILADEQVVMIEWPERVQALLPAQALWIQLDQFADAGLDHGMADTRRLTFRATGPRYETLLRSLRPALPGC